MKKINKYISNIKTSLAKNKHPNDVLVLPLPVPAVYHAGAMRIPFEASQGLQPNKQQSINPLLNYPVSVLKFVGTLAYDNHLFAYVRAPDNKLYQISFGDMVGDHHGMVTNISKDHLDVKEVVFNKGKLVSQHIVTLQLKEENR